MTRGIDLITPGSRVRVTGDLMVDNPEHSYFIGCEGTVTPDDAGADVAVTFDGDPDRYHFATTELEVIAPPADSTPQLQVGDHTQWAGHDLIVKDIDGSLAALRLPGHEHADFHVHTSLLTPAH